jgi:hypothetical protein
MFFFPFCFEKKLFFRLSYQYNLFTDIYKIGNATRVAPPELRHPSSASGARRLFRFAQAD